MATLHRHLQLQDAEHDRLEFRADCPHCQIRLAGRYPAAHPLSHRAEVALATSVVAAGALLPTVGATASIHNELPLRSTPPAVVVGNGDQAGPHVGGSRRGAAVDGGGHAASRAPAHSPDVQVDLPAPTTPPRRPDTPPAPQPTSTSEAPPVRSTRPSPGPTAPGLSTAGSTRSGETRARPTAVQVSGGTPATPRQASPSPPGARDGRGQRGVGSEGASERGGAGVSSRAAGASGTDVSGRHVVRSGESLWLVAEHMLGDRATDAEIAAAVEQLWELNAGRIATGDPDLIYPGQALRLP